MLNIKKLNFLLISLMLLTSCNRYSTISITREIVDTETSEMTTSFEETQVINNRISKIINVPYDINKTKYDTLIKFEKDGRYGLKNENDHIVVEAKYDFISKFDNSETTSVLAYIKRTNNYTINYIDKTGQVVLSVEDQDVDISKCSNFYNGYALYNNKFINKEGTILYNDDKGILFKSIEISYWGNNYYQMYYTPSIDGITVRGNLGLVDVEGNVQLNNSNIYITELNGDYAIVNSEKWCAVIDRNLDVKIVFYNIINCSDDLGVAVPNYLTNVSFAEEDVSEKQILKVIKPYSKVTVEDVGELRREIQSIFDKHYNPKNVEEYYCQTNSKYDMLSRNEYFKVEKDFQYAVIDIADTINEN